VIAMRLRLLLCLVLAVGVGAFAFLRKVEGKVVVTYVRSERSGEFWWTVFAIRNDTEQPVMSVEISDKAPKTPGRVGAGTLIEPQSTMEVSTLWDTGNQPRVVYVYVVPWTLAEQVSAEERYSRFPEPIRTWFMRKYDVHRPAYRHEVQLP